MLGVLFVACGNVDDNNGGGGNNTPPAVEHIDYASQLKLDMSTDSLKEEVTVKNFVDGDTTHFYVDNDVVDTGVLKARYLAVDTPESTGQIEDYGHKASRFTKEKLRSAVSIIIESDNNKWNADSTGERYLVWVWYKTSANGEYRNLNLELLQNGLAIAKNTGGNRYGTIAMNALNQAKAERLNVHSGVADPEVYKGEAVPVSMRELRVNIEEYTGVKVAVEGIVVQNFSNTVYVEAYDEETDMYYGISVYYGFGLSGRDSVVLSMGNEVRIVGTVQYYETGGTYQISGLKPYDPFNPDDPDNLQLISEDKEGAYTLVSANDFVNGKVTVEYDEEDQITTKTFDFKALAMSSSISMENLTVTEVYTTTNEESSQKGAMTLTCKAEDGTIVTIRTVVLKDEEGNVLTKEYFMGKKISVKGIVDYFSGDYQIKVYRTRDISFV